MITKQLLQPESIVVIGGSNNVHKPGGAVVRNLLSGGFKGKLHVLNPKEDEVQGIKAVHEMKDIPHCDLAILVVAARFCPDYVEFLAAERGVRAFIIISAGFGEETKEGGEMEKRIVDTCNRYGASLIGPNCIGLLTRWHHSVFTKPIPSLNPHGADFISGSGATAVFILESAVSKGLQFNSVWSIGNGKQIGVEDVLEYMDEHFDAEKDSHVKLLYIENISKPAKMLRHASSLISKGCRIAAVKSGASESGSRAASSHTGAIASSDSAVDALFRKAGIVRCYSREELTTMGCVFMALDKKEFMTKPLKNADGTPRAANFAIVTHAGGPGVMLTDALSKGGLNVPKIEGAAAQELKSLLLPGSSVANPIDILATGTAEHLGLAIDYCEKKFDNIDGIFVIFGTPGLVELYEPYEVLHQKIQECRKPIFPILPSPHTAGAETREFISKGNVAIQDEVSIGNAIVRLLQTPAPASMSDDEVKVDVLKVREIIDGVKEDGYVAPDVVRRLLECAGVPLAPEMVSASKTDLVAFAERIGYPVVAKVVGPVHKSDVGGVVLNVRDSKQLEAEFDRMMQIKDATAVMIQKMLKGTELFIGAKYEPSFGHTVLCGLGGIFVEVLKDVANGLAPISHTEAERMVHSLRGYKILKGVRGQQGINERKYIDIIVGLSVMLSHAPEIKEMDINPLLAAGDDVVAVDARILIEKN